MSDINPISSVNSAEFRIGALLTIAIVIGIANIQLSYSNALQLMRLEEQTNGIENVLQYKMDVNQKLNQLQCNHIEKCVVENASNMQKIVTDALTHNVLIVEKPHYDEPVDINDFNGVSETKQEPIINAREEDELLNECYDSIPLNNLKKNTSISWLF